jgi:putative ABC transport system permease protein
MNRALVKTSYRYLMRKPLQSLLMLLGIALGVAVVVAIDLANQSSRKAFQLSAEALVGRATHQIRGGPSGISEAFYRQLRVDFGVRTSAPIVEGIATALDLDQQPIQILGVDPLAESPFRNYLLDAPHQLPGFERFYTDPFTVIISEGFANRYGLGLGDDVQLQINDRLETVQILAILLPRDGDVSAALDDVLLMDLASAQELTNSLDRLSRIDLILSENDATRLSQLLPSGVRLQPASQQSSTVAELTSAFELNLTALSLLALVVGMFLIYNTMMFSVVRRRSALGTLRALGVTDRGIFGLVTFEALVIGVIGSTFGVILGYILGQGAIQLVSQTINDLYFIVTVSEVSFTPITVIKGLLIGIGASLLAAGIPALEATRVPPVTVLRRSGFEEGFHDLIPRLRNAGVVLVVFSLLLLIVIPNSLGANFGALFLLILGIALAVPWSVAVGMGILAKPLNRLLGVRGRFAARRVIAALSRTSVAIAALMISLSVTIGVSVMISSFRSTVENWLDITLRADLYISAPSPGGTRPSASLPPDLAQELVHINGVETVETFRAVLVDSPLGEVQLSVADSKRERDGEIYRFAGGTPGEVWEQVVEGAVIVSEPFAFRYNIPPSGGEVVLFTDRGERTFPVAGIYYDYSSDRGAVLMSDRTYRQLWDDPTISSIALYLEEEADMNFVADQARDSLAKTGLLVQENLLIRDQALGIFDRTFAITSALRILTVFIAFVGILSSLLALLLERSREGATMQALGMTPEGLVGTTLLESGLIGAIAGVLSWPTGILMAMVLIFVINLRSFGWTIQMQIEPVFFLQALFVGIVAALLATIYPVLKLLRSPIAEALRGE